jgi:hypothetical protein
MRHAGYVSRNYVQGYWHHRFHECPDSFFKLISHIPDLERILVDYHALRLGNPNRSSWKAAGKLFRKEMRRALRLPGGPNPAPRPFSSKCVQGFWPDGWLAPVAHFASAALRSGQMVQLRGVPAVDCCLKVQSGATIAGAKMLIGGVETTIDFIAAGDDATLAFDAFHVDSIGRQIAFFITHTNLFSEEEL